LTSELPEGTKVKGIFPYGASVWTRTAEIQTQQADGSELSFFLKVQHLSFLYCCHEVTNNHQVCQNETGKGMMSGEFSSMSAIHAAVPGLAPAPIAWGTYASDPNTHFFIMSFVEMTDEIPELDTFPAKLAELHRNGLSPTGKFGFTVQNYQGALPQVVTWRDTWEEAFTEGLRAMVIREEKSQGPNEEMIGLLKQLFDRVIPRLLRPLQTGGRSIEPRLVHGDLWDGNCSTSIETDQPVIFDASCLYAHNECRYPSLSQSYLGCIP
jgi:protein-ribulosamine 3-kinase